MPFYWVYVLCRGVLCCNMGVPGVPKETAATPAHDTSTVATEVVFVLLGIIGSVILLVVVLSIVFGVLLKSRGNLETR